MLQNDPIELFVIRNPISYTSVPLNYYKDSIWLNKKSILVLLFIGMETVAQKG